MAQELTIQEQLVQLATIKNNIQKTEHTTLVSLEAALLDANVDALMASLNHAVENLAVTDALKNTAGTLLDLLKTARVVAQRERMLSEQAIAAHG
ncbi:hypothetical protein CPT_Seuss30 [Caulobacter phage Seuss]|uniref:Uncharacterized protein n=1 Tax=Caulobacter phage Seuss TaxID=1675601 RepID=A0A0K1LM27_9CAUD|nr:hypothetical protein HOR08_gp030 [Caulobacter phage Seuss]AKU43556.1 hypothetical protein CPT_Seuss30 [Caulobacter phage Seuss]